MNSSRHANYFLVALMLSALSLVPVTRAAEAPKPEICLEKNTLKGTVRVPRGQTILLKERASYLSWDVVILYATVPSDFPSEFLEFKFDFTVLVDEHGLGAGWHWHTVDPAGYLLTGNTLSNYDIQPNRGKSGLRLPESFLSSTPFLRDSWTSIREPTRLCDWRITLQDSPADDIAGLELWVSPDAELLQRSVFHAPGKDFENFPRSISLQWKKIND